MIIIHSFAHHVIIFPKFTFPTKESIWGRWWVCPVSLMGWNSCIWSLLTVLKWAPLCMTAWSATQVPRESRRILTFISQEINQACLYGRKATAYYSTTILNFIVKFSASPVQKTVMKESWANVRFLFLVFCLFLDKEETKETFYSLTDRFLHSSWDHSITQSRTPWQSI